MITSEAWAALRDSVQRTTRHLADIVERAPEARATKRWSVVETAVHTATVAHLHTGSLQPGRGPDIAGLPETLRAASVDTVSDLNEVTMAEVATRDRAAVADLLRARVDDLVQVAGALDPESTVEWLGGSHPTVAGLLAHMLNELSIHGRDIARAAHAQWSTPAHDAAMFIGLFVQGVVRHGYGHLLDTAGPPTPGRIAVQFRPRTGDPLILVLRDGVVELGSDPVDVRVTYDPVMLNLMMFGRVSKARAILTGRVVVGGRRPWLLPTFLRTVRMPS
jgi:hypothetical protein